MNSATSSTKLVATLLGCFVLLPICQADPAAVSDDFSNPKLSEKWAAAKGAWVIEDGQLKGSEIASDEHAAVLTYRAPHQDSKVSLSFQLAGSKGFHLSFNHPKGHLFRVAVSQTDARLSTDKDKKDPASKSEKLDEGKAKFEQGKTYTMTCQTQGDTATVTFDNGLELKGTHPALARDKTGYRLVVKGNGVLFDNFQIEAPE